MPAVAIANDSFTRADSTTSLGTASSGQTWTAGNGTWGINTNQAYLPATSGTTTWQTAFIDIGTDNQYVQFNSAIRDGVGQNIGLLIRCTDNNNWFGLHNNGFGGGWQVYKCVAGVYSSVGTFIDNASSNGSIERMEVSSDNIVRFTRLNAGGTRSATTFTLSDSVLLAGGGGTKVGMLALNTTTTAARWDDWQAGALVPSIRQQSHQQSVRGSAIR